MPNWNIILLIIFISEYLSKGISSNCKQSELRTEENDNYCPDRLVLAEYAEQGRRYGMITDIETIIENMEAAGCNAEDVSRARAMYDAGLESEILRCMRKCRCSLMDELHETQKRVDRMDRTIRMAEESFGQN